MPLMLLDSACCLLAAQVAIKCEHRRFYVGWEPVDRCSRADQGDYIWCVKACKQKCQPVKCSLDQDDRAGKLVGINSEPACGVGFDPTPGSSWLIQQRLVGILVHAWLPVPQGAPDVSLAGGRSQGEKDAFFPPAQNGALLLRLQVVDHGRWQVADA